MRCSAACRALQLSGLSLRRSVLVSFSACMRDARRFRAWEGVRLTQAIQPQPLQARSVRLYPRHGGGEQNNYEHSKFFRLVFRLSSSATPGGKRWEGATERHQQQRALEKSAAALLLSGAHRRNRRCLAALLRVQLNDDQLAMGANWAKRVAPKAEAPPLTATPVRGPRGTQCQSWSGVAGQSGCRPPAGAPASLDR